MRINFEFLVLFGLCSLLVVIFIAPDHESKVIYARIVESLVTGFLGYITRGIVEEKLNDYSRNTPPNYSMPPENDYSIQPLSEQELEKEELLRRRRKIREELDELNDINDVK